MRIVLIATLMVMGCGKKSTPEAAPKSAPAVEMGAEMPDSKEARQFAEKLVGTTVTNWAATGSSDFAHKSLDFETTGKWNATAAMTASLEEIDCKESGTWRILEAVSATEAVMDWTVDKTTCPTRTEGEKRRVNMIIKPDGDYKISFR